MNTVFKRRLAVIHSILLSITACGNAYQPTTSRDVFDRLAENWRWSRYWFGKTGIEDVYSEGKRVSVLMFWTKGTRRSKSGFCSTELSLCVALTGPYLDPSPERMHVDKSIDLIDAFRLFVQSDFGGAESYLSSAERLSAIDFETNETFVTLPPLTPPASVLQKVVPLEALEEADRLKQLLGCGGRGRGAPALPCSGTLVFAFYGPADPYWFVLRTCSDACQFRGSTVQELTRGDRGWEITSRGYVSGSDVEHLKQQIEKAEMFRIALK